MIETILLSLVIIPISLILLIGFHEYGHFSMAKILNVGVTRFAIGFGKPIYLKKSRTGTEYALCALPLGGYVKLEENLEIHPIYKRALIIIAGPAFNIILGLLAYWLVFFIGISQPLPIIGHIELNSLANKSGLKPHTQIIEIDHHPTQTWAAVTLRLLPHLGKSDTITITTKNDQQQIQTYQLPLHQWTLNDLRPNLLSSLGITPQSPAKKIHRREYGFFHAFDAAFQECIFYIQVNGIILGKMLTGIVSIKSLVGPIGLFAATVTAANLGFVIFLTYIGFISVSLAFINLLPIPGLDGSHLVYLLFESISRKPVSIRVQVLLFRLGFIALSLLMIQALMNDVMRLT